MISVPEEPSADNRGLIPVRSVDLPPKKIRRAFKAQHGHSSGEQCLYVALWDAGAKEGRESRLITIGWNKMASLACLDEKNARIACGRLLDKLALDLVAPENSKRNTGRTYRVWSWSKVIERRIAAGMEWYIKTRGVEFVRPPDEFPEAQVRWDARFAQKPIPGGETPTGPLGETSPGPLGETPTGGLGNQPETPPGPLGETPTGPVGVSPPPLNTYKIDGNTSSSSYPCLVEVLRTIAGHADDDAARRILEGCLAQAPDATEEEIAHFIATQAARVAKNPRIDNLVGFLIHQVPKCFQGESFRRYRESEKERLAAQARYEAERQQAYLEMEAEHRAILADPNASEADKRFARQMLDLS